MFKRANKITAILVAAASIMSVVPAMADDASTSRLGSKDGHITNAVAYKDGKYVYQGYRTDDDTDSIYYNAGDKDKEIDNIKDSTLDASYEDKYAFANDGSDQYLVDLTSGTETDDTTPKDDLDTAATKLQTKLNKADRYKNGGDVSVDSGNLIGTQSTNTNEGGLVTLPGNKFGDSWYSYDVTTNSSDADKYVAQGRHLYGFTDGSGKYIDASYTANIYAYSTKEGKTVKIENFSNNYDDTDSDTQLLATLVKQPVALTQDKDYIYALTTVAITDTDAQAKDASTTTGSSAYVASIPVQKNADGTVKKDANNNVVYAPQVTTVRTYIQKIAKAQGDQKDDAYLPKTVESYEVGNSTGNEYDCGDAKDAYTAIGTAISDANSANGSDLTSITQNDVVLRTNNGEVRPIFTISDGNLIAIEATNDKVDAFTLKFKKDKLKFKDAPNKAKDGVTSSANAVSFGTDTKVDAYFLEKDSDDSVDLDNDAKMGEASAYDVDVDGNVWVVADGKIYKYKAGGDMTKVYTCDSSLDAISVYDENSMFAWERNGDIYTTVNEGKAATSAEDGTTTAAVTATTGWKQLADGTWTFYDATGTMVVNNWSNVGGTWYYLGDNGIMATGWKQVNGTWYYMNASGAMQTGWVQTSGTWYYLKSSGAMATGWVNDNGTWYYCDSTGAMLANTTTPDGYYVNASGAWV